jgi:hypothetical protein
MRCGMTASLRATATLAFAEPVALGEPYSPDSTRDMLYTSNYAAPHVKDLLAHLPGLGDVQIIGGRRRGGDDPVSTTRTKPHRPKERNDDRPQDRDACYASLEGRASPILICWARNSRKTRIRIGRSPPCPR